MPPYAYAYHTCIQPCAYVQLSLLHTCKPALSPRYPYPDIEQWSFAIGGSMVKWRTRINMKRVPIWKMNYWSKVCGFSVLPWRRKLTQTSMWLLALFFLLGDEKFELAVINPGLILGPVLHGSTCTSMEVQTTCIILSSSRRSSVDRFAERMLLHTLLNGTNCCSLFRILNGVAAASSLSTLLFISPLGNSSCRLQIPYQNGSWNNKD